MKNFLLAICLLLAACASQNQRQQVSQKALKDGYAACNIAYSSGQIATAEGMVHCLHGAWITVEQNYGPSRDNDIFEMMYMKELAVAKRKDKGEISKEEASAEIASIEVEANNMSMQRDAAVASVRSARAAEIGAQAAILNGMQANRPVSCYTMGATTNCY